MNLFNTMNHLKILDFLSSSRIAYWNKFLSETSSFSASDIKEYQENQFKKIVDHTYKNSLFYRNQFSESNFSIQGEDLIERLSSLPILRKEIVKDNYADILSKNANDYKYLKRRTGGTTGVPLSYLYDKDSWSLGWALKIRDWGYGNYKIGDKMALLGGASLVPDQKVNLKRDIWNHFNGFIPLSTTHFDKNILKNYYNILLKERIRFLRGYPSSLLAFAEHLKSNKLSLPIEAIFTTAEVLQKDHRIFIEDVFNCKIFDQYGAADACAHASECNHHNGFHVSFEPSICEIVNVEENFDGKKIGELVYTSLTNYSLPLLRYAPGDLAELQESSCTCGRETLMVKRIIGRTTERILFSNGRILAGPAFTLIFRKFDIKNYQLVQNTKDSLDINVVRDDKYTLDQENELLRIMKFQCGDNVEINLNYLKEIPIIRSGKQRFIISNI